MGVAILIIANSGGVRGDDALDPAERVRQIRVETTRKQMLSQLTGGETRADLRTQFERTLKQKIDDLDRICVLTDSQTEKFTIAGRTEIDRFFNELDKALDEFERLFQEENADGIRRNAIRQNILVQVQRKYGTAITQHQKGLFEKDSLLEKSIRKSLTPEQQQRVNQIHEERLAAKYRAHVEGVVVHWDQNLALRKEQRRQLVELLLKETASPPEGSKLRANAVWIQAAHLPEERFLAILDREQWQLLQQELEHVRENEELMKQDPLPGGGFF